MYRRCFVSFFADKIAAQRLFFGRTYSSSTDFLSNPRISKPSFFAGNRTNYTGSCNPLNEQFYPRWFLLSHDSVILSFAEILSRSNSSSRGSPFSKNFARLIVDVTSNCIIYWTKQFLNIFTETCTIYSIRINFDIWTYVRFNEIHYYHCTVVNS